MNSPPELTWNLPGRYLDPALCPAQSVGNPYPEINWDELTWDLPGQYLDPALCSPQSIGNSSPGITWAPLGQPLNPNHVSRDFPIIYSTLEVSEVPAI
jgi:hypothetical protein